MSARQQAEHERVNALPRKGYGNVAYYYKPQTKYPPRIYVFMHSEMWPDRNRRPMGLHTSFPFLVRPMNSEEIEYHHFDIRLCYHQYEDWDKLVYAEEQEATQLDKEKEGSGTAFLEKLKSFRNRYRLVITDSPKAVSIAEPAENEEMRCLRELLRKADHLTAPEISALLEEEQQGQQRTTILILLRELYKAAGGEKNSLNLLTPEIIQRKAVALEDRKRKNYVRRVYRDNPLFAVEEIRNRYPGYDEQALMADLKRKPGKVKRHNLKQVLDLRRVQLGKLAARLNLLKEDDQTYNAVCGTIVMLEEAHRLRAPIPITVTYQKKSEVYYFHWKTRETVVKSFVRFANQPGQNHEACKIRHQEIISSNYSF